MNKETLLKILNLSKEQNITERKASELVTGFIHKDLSYWKKKYNIPCNYNHHIYTRKYKVDDKYFSILDKQNCYWGGFIAADGNISKENHLTIGLQYNDYSHLEMFIKHLKATYKIHIGTSKNIYKYASVHIASMEIARDLKRHFNIVPAKSLILQPPNINFNDKTLIDSYIIGLIDGDGTIGFRNLKNKQKALYISLVGTSEILNFVKTRFEEILGKATSNLQAKRNVYTICVSNKQARTLFLHFYDIPIYKLDRKWSKEKYEYCINYKKANPTCKCKGVHVFDINGHLLKTFDTLKEASEYTGVSIGRISSMCKFNDNTHIAHEYMFSRDNTMKKYIGNEHDYTSQFKNIKNIEDNN